MECTPQELLVPLAMVFILDLPFQVLMLKCLIKDMRFSQPRHLFLLSLSISDGLKISMTLICLLISDLLRFSIEGYPCLVTRKIILTSYILTFYISSITTVLLSMERYVACIHSFRFYTIMGEKKVLISLAFIWISGTICTAISAALTHQRFTTNAVIVDEAPKTIIIFASLVSSIIISMVQIRLLIFTRSKQNRVMPSRRFGVKAELADYRRKQLKVTFVACIVATAYMVCMLPSSIPSLYEMFSYTLIAMALRGKLGVLTFISTLVNPIIYGFGVADTRKYLLKTIKRCFNFFKCYTYCDSSTAAHFQRTKTVVIFNANVVQRLTSREDVGAWSYGKGEM